MKVVVETDRYAAVRSPEGRDGKDNWEDAMRGMLEVCERLRAGGYRPLHYVPRLGVWVCEKDEHEQRSRKTAA